MTTTILYPSDGDGIDSELEASNAGQNWAAKQAVTNANNVQPSQDHFRAGIHAHTATNEWKNWQRSAVTFDAAEIGTGEQVDSGIFSLVSIALTQDAFTDSHSLVSCALASPTNVEVGDWDSFGTTKYAADQAIGSMPADSSTYIDWTLNAAGIAFAEASLDGVIQFAINSTAVVDDNEPTWSPGDRSIISYGSAEEVLSGDKRPKLAITHSTISGDPENYTNFPAVHRRITCLAY
tara:strand:+ start:156 stop:863 length:708 start_codon:yes stop_codon:yes gene_type:complete